jgi:hypothetical protein
MDTELARTFFEVISTRILIRADERDRNSRRPLSARGLVPSRDNWTALSHDESASPTLQFNCKNAPENDGLVMQLVASRKDERERIVSHDSPKLAEEFSFMGELSLVSPAELDPSARVMA